MSDIEKYQFNNRTADEQRKIASAGGKASGEARRLKKTLADFINEEWAEPIKVNGKELTKKQLAALRLVRIINNPATTDREFLKALEFARDTIGEKPIEKVEMATIDQSVIDEVERLAKEIKN